MIQKSKPPIPAELVILREIAESLGYQVSTVDSQNQNLIQVTDPETKKNFFASNTGLGTYPINSHNNVGLTKDKLWTKLVLDRASLPTIPTRPVFTRPTLQEKRQQGYEVSDTLNWAQDQKFPLFIKPNKGSHGNNASFVWSVKDLEQKITTISQNDYLALISPIVQKPEYRIFVLKGQIKFSYKREHANILGDGQQTVKEILNEIPPDDAYITWQLSQLNLNQDSILPEATKLNLTECSNLSQGGEPTEIKFSHTPELNKWAQKVSNELGSQVCGIDVFTGPNGLEDVSQLSIIEVNGNPGLAGLYNAGHAEKVEEVWKEVLETYFK